MRFVLLALALFLPLAAQGAPSPPPPPPITVFAAASLQESLDEVVRLWTERSHQLIVVSYAASSALARQIEQGAPVQVFFSADLEWMDYLQTRDLIVPGTRQNIVRNRLVLVAPTASGSGEVALTSEGLSTALGNGRLAVAETVSVPAGRYARQALVAMELWDGVAERTAEADNVRAALAFVARGEAPLGIVYITDAKAEPKVRVVAEIPSTQHAPIVYPVARLASAEAVQAEGFLDFLAGPEARAVFDRAGFEAP